MFNELPYIAQNSRRKNSHINSWENPTQVEADKRKRKFESLFQQLTEAYIIIGNNNYCYIPKKRLRQLRSILYSNKELIMLDHILRLWKMFTQIEEGRSANTLERMNTLLLMRLDDLMNALDFRNQLSPGKMLAIFHALPRLGAYHDDHKSLYNHLIAQTLEMSTHKYFAIHQRVTIINALIRLEIPWAIYKKLLFRFLAEFCKKKPNKEQSQEISDPRILPQLWEILFIAKEQSTRTHYFNNLFNYVEELVKAKNCALPPRISDIQRTVYHTIRRMLPRVQWSQLVLEYPAGPYSLDIAFPAEKINVEVDGPFHYRCGKLLPKDKLRDRILKQSGWRTVRISYLQMNPHRFNADSMISLIREKLLSTGFILQEQKKPHQKKENKVESELQLCKDLFTFN